MQGADWAITELNRIGGMKFRLKQGPPFNASGQAPAA
jgi:hypothetical protein